jgi:hypothetical protein
MPTSATAAGNTRLTVPSRRRLAALSAAGALGDNEQPVKTYHHGDHGEIRVYTDTIFSALRQSRTGAQTNSVPLVLA